MNASPWLPQTVSTTRLENDLRARGYSLRWNSNGVTISAPDGWRVLISAKTSSTALRGAYASAQEHANEQTVQQIKDQQAGWTA